MLQCAHNHLEKKGLVIYVPSVWEWCSGWNAFRVTDEGDYAQKEVTQRLLKRILDMNGAILAQPALQPLVDVLKSGIKDADSSHSALESFMAQLETIENVKVLIAIDQFNGCFATTQYHDQSSVPIPAQKLKLVKTFLPYFTGQKTMVRFHLSQATNSSSGHDTENPGSI